MSATNNVTGIINIVHCSSDALQTFMALIINQSPNVSDMFTFEGVKE